MKVFKDLEFKSKFPELLENELFKDAKQAVLYFDNGYGISVITGYGSYSDLNNPYECAVLFNGLICYSTDITDDVVGHCTEHEVTDIMVKIQSLENERPNYNLAE